MDCIITYWYPHSGGGELRINSFQKIISRKVGELNQVVVAFETEDNFKKELNRIKEIIDNKHSKHLELKTGKACVNIDDCDHTYLYKFAIYQQYGGNLSCEVITESDVLFEKTEEDYRRDREEIIRLSKEFGVEDAIKKIFGSNYENL
jgi:hypothetical protein